MTDETASPGRRTFGRWLGTVLIAGATLGCGGGDAEQGGVEPTQPENTAEREPPEPTREERWDALLERAEAAIAEERLDDVREALGAIPLVDDKPLDDERRQRVEAVEERLAAVIREREERELAARAERRTELLAEARRAVETDRLEEATKLLADLRAAAPTDEQRATAAQLDDDIERIRTARRRLGSWLKLLGSENPAEVRAARNQLAREPDALPLVVAMLRQPDEVRVRNVLELLHQMRRPDRTLPEVVALLRQPEHRANWADAVSVIVRSRAAGTGRALLDLAAGSADDEQRRFALEALVAIPDPPRDTLTTLLPRIHADDPELPLALRASSRAALVHHQSDFAARRNLPADLDDARLELLQTLPERLQSIVSIENAAADEAVSAAHELRTVLRLDAPSKLEGVRVLVANDAPPDGPASALLDGVWNSTDLATMWRYPDAQTGTVILDLGEERTVTAVRVWNFNQPGGQYRGWRDVDVYVSEGQTALDPVTRGTVLRAPGADNPPNYVSEIPVPFVRGRYVKLVEITNWGSNTYEGLAEIEVLGF